MNTIIRNILAVVIGIILGGAVNMVIIMISGFIIPPPDGVDLISMESLKSTMHLFEAWHFIMPFLAHALGTLVKRNSMKSIACHALTGGKLQVSGDDYIMSCY